MSVLETTCPAETAMPSSFRVPAVGSVVTLTADSAFAGESLGSENPNAPAPKVCVPSSATVTELSAPAGASLTLVTVTLTVAVSDLASAALLVVPLSVAV